MELFGIAITLLAAILTYLAWNNGRWMKLAHQDTIELLKKMDSTLHEIAKLVVAEGERTRQVIPPS